jgi:hypothetical protein
MMGLNLHGNDESSRQLALGIGKGLGQGQLYVCGVYGWQDG